MYQEPRLRRQFINDDHTLKKKAIGSYQRKVERFKELLWLCMHFGGGQPARAPELLGIRWKNTSNGGIRNIFIEEGLVSFICTYHKGYRGSGNIKIINRFLPREIGELVVYYLLVVVPFSERLQAKVTGIFQTNPFLWGDGAKKEHRQGTGPKRRDGEEPVERQAGDITGHSDDGESVDAAQQGELVAQRHAQTWTSERVRKIMQEASGRWMGVQVGISAWRQVAIAISRRYCREERFEEEGGGLKDGEEWDEDNTDGDDPWDLQAGHGTHVAGMIYARELATRSDVIIGRREKFRRVSHVWHCWRGSAT